MQDSREYARGGQRPPGAPSPLNVQAEIRTLKAGLATLSNTVKQMGGNMTKRREQIPFSQTLAVAGAAGSGAILYEAVPFSSFVKQVTIHWPGGCNALVDVRVGYELTQFCPRENFLALDAATPTYEFNWPVVKDRQIWVEMRNRDGAWPHTITVTVIVEEA